MDVRTSRFRAFIFIAVVAGLTGCKREVTRPNDIGTYSEAAIALSKIPTSQLKHCDTTLTDRKNAVGELLADFNEMAGKGGTCAVEHNGLVDYLLDTMKKLGLVPGVPLK